MADMKEERVIYTREIANWLYNYSKFLESEYAKLNVLNFIVCNEQSGESQILKMIDAGRVPAIFFGYGISGGLHHVFRVRDGDNVSVQARGGPDGLELRRGQRGGRIGAGLAGRKDFEVRPSVKIQ